MADPLDGRPSIAHMKDVANATLDEIERRSRGREAPAVSLVPYSTSVNIDDLGTDLLAGFSVTGIAAPLAGADVWAAERLRGADGDGFDLGDKSPGTAPIPFLTA